MFAGCCAALVVIVYFFVIETKDRSLEEIDTMYVLGVNPRTSSRWDGSKAPGSSSGESSNGAAPASATAGSGVGALGAQV